MPDLREQVARTALQALKAEVSISSLSRDLRNMALSEEAIDQPLLKDRLMRLLLLNLSSSAQEPAALLRYVQEISKLAGFYVEKKEVKVDGHGMSPQEEREWAAEVARLHGDG